MSAPKLPQWGKYDGSKKNFPLMPLQNLFNVFAQNFATEQPSMPPTKCQNLVHVEVIAFRLDKKSELSECQVIASKNSSSTE